MKIFATRLLILAFAVLTTIQATAQTAASQTTLNNTTPTYTPKANDVLAYKVTTPTATYNLTVTVKTLGATVSFDWFTNAQTSQKGAIAFDNADADNAMTLTHFFTPAATKLKGKTCLWASKTIYKLLKANTTANITFENAAVADRIENKGAGTFVVNINGVPTKLSYIKAANNTNNPGGKELWMLDNEQSPLIVYMNMGWTLELKSIKQQ